MAKGTPLPAILIANDLLDGDVVFLGAFDWERDHRKALIATSEEDAAMLVARGGSAVAGNEIVDPYLAQVSLTDGVPTPLHYREKLRTTGPSTRRDLGKQAIF